MGQYADDARWRSDGENHYSEISPMLRLLFHAPDSTPAGGWRESQRWRINRHNSSFHSPHPAARMPGMSEPKKKAGVGFWATIIVLGVFSLQFLYLLALGPEQYLFAKG